MQDNYSESSLDAAIVALENRQAIEAGLLKIEFQQAIESVRPVNLIKSTLAQIAGSSELKGNILNTTVALGAGFVSKKAFVGFSHSPLKRMIGTALMFGVTNLVAKNPVLVKMAGLGILRLLKRKTKALPPENGALDPDSSLFNLK